MSLANLSTFENQANFHSLAIFICHLFTSGGFQTARIIYDPRVFNDQLIISVDSECFGKISWTTSDLTKSRPKEQRNELNTLQLVFPNLDDPAWYAVFLNTSSLHYHLLMIPPKANNWTDIFDSIKFLHSNTLIAKSNQQTQTITFYTKVRNLPFEFIYEYDERNPPKNLFTETFGKVRSTWILGIHYSTSAICFGEKHEQALTAFSFWSYLAKFYSNQFRNSFLNGSTSACGNHSSSFSLHSRRSTALYEEIDPDVRLDNINSKIFKNNETPVIGLHFAPFRLDSEKYPYAHVHNLYPFTSVRFMAIFIYGEDYLRPHPPGILTILSVGNYWFIFIWFLLATVSLFIIRWKAGVKHNDNTISSSILDMIVVFCGGGRLRFRNKYDKVYLIIMIIGSFFLISLCTSKFKSRITSSKELDNINTFEKLSKLRVPVYVSNAVGNDTQHVIASLRKRLSNNLNLKGKSTLYQLANLTKAFVFVSDESELQLAKLYATEGFDIIQGDLGAFPRNFILASSRRIPRVVDNKINNLMSRIVESGILDFYSSLSQFFVRIRGVDALKDDTDYRRVSMKQFYFPFMIYLIAMMVSIVVFILEIIHFKCQKKRRITAAN